jgi:hypothetical protein
LSDAIDIDYLERKAYLAYHEDGLIDVLTGVILTYTGLFILSDVDFPLLSWFVIMTPLLYAEIKRRVTDPRIGHVKFGPGRRRRQQKVVMVIALIVNVLLVLSFFLERNTLFEPWRAVEPVWGVLIAGTGIISLVLYTIGHLNEVSRFRWYSGFSIVLFSIAHFVTAPSLGIFERMAYAGIPLGCIMIFNGILNLWRFLQKYPKLSDGEVDV